MFGSAPQGGGLFGSAPQQPAGGGLFGAQAQPQGGGIFGGAQQQQQPQGGGLFGANPQQQQGGGLFGAQPQQQGGGLFGAQPQQQGGGVFGGQPQQQQGGGLFGGQPQQQQQGGLFGAQPQQQQGGGIFGAQPQQQGGGLFGGQQQPQQGGGLFGAQQPQQQQGGGLFGSQQQQQQGGGLFGAQQQQQQQGGGLFGAQQPQQQQGGGLFGAQQPQQQQGGGLFGAQQPQQQQSGGLFGGQQQQQQGGGLFGAQPQQQQGGGLFGGQQQQQQGGGLFGAQPQQQQGGGLFGGQQQQQQGAFGQQNVPNPNHDLIVPGAATDTISCLVFSAAGDKLAVASWDKHVRIFGVVDAAQGPQAQPLHDIALPNSPALFCCFVGNDAAIALGDSHGQVWIASLSGAVAGQPVTPQPLGSHTAAVPLVGLAWMPQFSLLASCSVGQSCKLWRLPQAAGQLGQQALEVQVPGKAFGMDANDHGVAVAHLQTNATAGKSFAVAFYPAASLSQGNLTADIVPIDAYLSLTQLKLAPDTFMALVTGVEGRAHIVAPSNMYPQAKDRGTFKFRCHREEKPQDLHFQVNCGAMAPGGKCATGGGNGTVKFWLYSQKVAGQSLHSLGCPVTAVAFNPSGSLLAIAGGYDWAEGSQGAGKAAPGGGFEPRLFVHRVVPAHFAGKAR